MNSNHATLSRRGKTYGLICSLFLLCVFNPFKSFGQSVTDQAAIIKQCIDLPALQEFYTKNAEGNYQQVHIMQFPVSFEKGITVSKFGQPVAFESRTEVRTSNPEVLLAFKTLSVKDQTATAVFDFYYNRSSPSVTVWEVTVDLLKGENGWTIKNSFNKN